MKYCGVDYYPEQWGLGCLEEDLRNMKELGVNLIRIGDFAWDVMEKKEGEYDFHLFDEVIRKCEEYDIKVMMCIPTATMPSWLYQKDKSIMNVNEEGYAQPFGARRGYCYNSDLYKQKAFALAHAIARHYKGWKNIVAYQVDNEVGHEGSDLCYCENCHRKFIEYLQGKYKDINELNYRWGTSFWSQTYGDFEEIPLPKKAFTAQNPSLRLEWERFRSYSIVSYIKELVDAVKKEDDKPVTHDFSGGTINKHFNPFEVSRCLDFVSYNNYPVWGGQKAPMTESQIGFSLDFVKGFKRKPFWITEAIMGAQGHNDIGYAPRPNEAKKWSLQSLEHGAEAILFFRYRGFIKGAEQFCYGILDADNEKRRKYYETKDFFKEASNKKLPEIQSEACILYDYDSKSAMSIQRQSDAFSYEKECQKFYDQFYMRHMNVDILDSISDFSSYRIVVLPYMTVMSEEFKKRLKEYVKKGGIVIASARTAYKDEDNNLYFSKRIPADLSDLTGVVIEENESLLNGQSSICVYKGKEYEGRVFEEHLKSVGAYRLVEWKDDPFGDYAAAVVNCYGKGRCYYLGSSFDDKLLFELFNEALR